MKVVIAIDSLKGSLTSIQAAHAIEKGIKKVEKEAEVVIKPLADGGEGTVDALVDGMGGNMEFIKVTGPAGKPVLAKYGIILPTKSGMEGTSTVIMEMSQAAGITQVSDKERNPLYTTTYGVGQMITDAIHKGCRRFIMGIGGSATNDGGAGMLQALGYDFLDKDGNQIKHGAIGLKDLSIMWRRRLQCDFWSTKRCHEADGKRHGSVVSRLCKDCKTKLYKSRC